MFQASRLVAPVKRGSDWAFTPALLSLVHPGAVAAPEVKIGMGGPSYAWKYSKLLSHPSPERD